MCAAYYAAEHEYTLEKDQEMEKGLGPPRPSALLPKEGGAQTAMAAMRKITSHNGCQQNAGWRL